jgi:ketosteroid isomerase-like protein
MNKIIAGVLAAVGFRALMVRLLLTKLRRDMSALSAGDIGPVLASYHRDAVLAFNEGDHRWAGAHVGRAAIGRFLRNFTAAGLSGEIVEMWVGGPPWALRLAVRFDDQAHDGDGRLLYANRTVLIATTRWGKITRQEDFYEDTGRILAFERKLTERGRRPVE